MNGIRFLTSGESHGSALVGIIEGIPSGLSLSAEDINRDLARRQKGYGRGRRMKIESDTVRILSGIRQGKTIGSPIALLIENKDWKNWQDVMSPEPQSQGPQAVTRPRPGHADLAGAMKYHTHDIRNILERSSARETAARVAIGAVARKFLSEFDIRIISYVIEIGGIRSAGHVTGLTDEKAFISLFRKAEASPLRCPDKDAEKKMIKRIDMAMKGGDSLGGVFEVIILGVPTGLGSYIQWDRRLNARLAHAIMGIQAIKGVEIGLGFEMSRKSGSEVMDEIYYKRRGKQTAGGFYRRTNNAGGIEGGMSNGMPVVVRAAMKPIPTLRTPLSSVDIVSKRRFKAAYERSDVCAVPAASIVGEAMVAIVIADSFIEKFGGDSMEEVKRNYRGYISQIEGF